MDNEVEVVERIVLARIQFAEPFAVEFAQVPAAEESAVPGLAQLVGRHHEGAQRVGGLALHEAELAADFRRNDCPQRKVVEQAEQLDVTGGLFAGNAHGHVVGDHDHFRLEVDAVGSIIRQQERFVRPENLV